MTPFDNRGQNMDSPQHTWNQTAVEIVRFSRGIESALKKVKIGLSASMAIIFWDICGIIYQGGPKFTQPNI